MIKQNGRVMIPRREAAEFIAAVRKWLATGMPMPEPADVDLDYVKRRSGLTDEQRALFAQGLALCRQQGRECNPRMLGAYGDY
jgi:hypothetical protein